MNSPAASNRSSQPSPISEFSEGDHSQIAPLKPEDFLKKGPVVHIWNNASRFRTDVEAKAALEMTHRYKGKYGVDNQDVGTIRVMCMRNACI